MTRRVRVAVVYGRSALSSFFNLVKYVIGILDPDFMEQYDSLRGVRVATVVGVRNASIYLVGVSWTSSTDMVIERTAFNRLLPIIRGAVTISFRPEHDDYDVLRELVIWSGLIVGGSKRLFVSPRLAQWLGLECSEVVERVKNLRLSRLCVVDVRREPNIDVEPVIARLYAPCRRAIRALELSPHLTKVEKGGGRGSESGEEGGEPESAPGATDVESLKRLLSELLSGSE